MPAEDFVQDYESIEGATGVVADVNIRTIAAFSTLFDDVPIAKRVIIRTDAEISVGFNNTDKDLITIQAGEKFEMNWYQVAAIFITAVSTANIKVILGGNS